MSARRIVTNALKITFCICCHVLFFGSVIISVAASIGTQHHLLFLWAPCGLFLEGLLIQLADKWMFEP